ncbi:peptidoglycan DD-metalloendopeptidase family protein [Aliikangiella maris]|uniref:Peptidoglycan DD-metalloendopeptidase family protein n=2 Tax=Aliikangiella maris TaxID=3162458 RepID=A0ABV3MVI8_9GAMM
MNTQVKIENPVKNGKVRKKDKWGGGQYGASRGKRQHFGLDITANPGQDILSPIEGKIIRISYPYANDLKFTGLLINGSGAHTGIEVKIFYLSPAPGVINKSVTPGEKIGNAQALTTKYPGITNHVHIEIKRHGVQVDPKPLINNIF